MMTKTKAELGIGDNTGKDPVTVEMDSSSTDKNNFVDNVIAMNEQTGTIPDPSQGEIAAAHRLLDSKSLNFEVTNVTAEYYLNINLCRN